MLKGKKTHSPSRLNDVQFRMIYQKPISEGGDHTIDLRAVYFTPVRDKETSKLIGTEAVTDLTAGEMSWDHRGVLQQIQVDPNWRRKGAATKMWRYAQGLSQAKPNAIPAPVHSEERTPKGDKWAKSTGDPVPENIHPSHWYD